MMQRSIYSKAALCCVLSFFFLIVCIGKATIMQTALTNSLTICLTTILPSLTAMMILTRILTESGLLEQWNFLFGRLFHFLFRLPANFCSIFFISQIAGYPVGAAMLCPYFQTHANAKKELSAITSVCFGGGPAFLIGTVGAQFSNHRPCMYLFLDFWQMHYWQLFLDDVFRFLNRHFPQNPFLFLRNCWYPVPDRQVKICLAYAA